MISPISGYGSMNYNPVRQMALLRDGDKNADAADLEKKLPRDEAGKRAELPGAKDNAAKAFGDVLAKSSYGDTLQSSASSRMALKDGLVYAKPSINGTSDDSDPLSKAEVGSLKNYSQDQLEAMYLRGDITMIDYDQEIDQRAERELLGKNEEEDKKASESNAESEKEEKTTRVNAQGQPVEEKSQIEKSLEKKEPSVYEKNEEAAERKGEVKDTIAADNRFIEDMGQILATGKAENLQADAYQKGLENERLNMVIDIFDGKNKN